MLEVRVVAIPSIHRPVNDPGYELSGQADKDEARMHPTSYDGALGGKSCESDPGSVPIYAFLPNLSSVFRARHKTHINDGYPDFRHRPYRRGQ